MSNDFNTFDLQTVKNFYAEAFQTFDRQRRAPEIEVRLYPYIGINHTIRARDGKVFVRIAEICGEMPLQAQKALAFILVAKLLRKKVPAEARQVYSNYISNQDLREKASENKRARGRKIITSAKGEIYDLEQIFDALNALYFENAIKKPVLTWSSRETYRILGHHDAAHETIVVSRSLDNKKTPRFVVEYVVYHEMLHIFHPTTHRKGRRYNHTPAFRRDERKFAFFEEAESWIERNVKNLKRNAKKKKIKK